MSGKKNQSMRRRTVLKGIGAASLGTVTIQNAKASKTEPKGMSSVDTSDVPGLLQVDVMSTDSVAGYRMIGTVQPSNPKSTANSTTNRTYAINLSNPGRGADIHQVAKNASIEYNTFRNRQVNPPGKPEVTPPREGGETKNDVNLTGENEEGEDYLSIHDDEFTTLSDEIDEEDGLEDRTGNYELRVTSHLSGPGLFSSDSVLQHWHTWETSHGSVSRFEGKLRQNTSGNFDVESWGDGGTGFPDDNAYTENFGDFERSCVTCSGFWSHHRLRSEFLPNGNAIWEARIFTREYDGGPTFREDWEPKFSYSATL